METPKVCVLSTAWTGLGVVFPRSKWLEVRQRTEFARAGVYILVGYQQEQEEDDELPTIYIGQADGVRTRIESHFQNKDFWDLGIIFVSNSNSGGLNRAHVTWLEYALVDRATATGRCHLDNGNAPQEPGLSEAEKADTQGFSGKFSRFFLLSDFAHSKFPRQSLRREPQLSCLRNNLLSSLTRLLSLQRKTGLREYFWEKTAGMPSAFREG